MPTKPNKYVQKYWFAVDAESNYVLNGSSYLGKDEYCPDDQCVSDFGRETYKNNCDCEKI
jgi:hypothetical protein